MFSLKRWRVVPIGARLVCRHQECFAEFPLANILYPENNAGMVQPPSI
jgi:hypothetical protein